MTAPVMTNGASPTTHGFKVDPQVTHQSHSIKVAVRLRPLYGESDKQNDKRKNKLVDKRAWMIDKHGSMDTLVQKGHARRIDGRTVFHFDHVFDEDIQTPLIYKSIARPMVRSVLNGKHATIFAYGQTGSGKTFTMQGDGKAQSGQAGIVQLVASDLFRFMRQGEAARREFVVKVSYFEIYNEKIRDLLSNDSGSSQSEGLEDNRNSSMLSSDEDIKIRANASGEIVMNVTQAEVTNVDEVLELLIEGNTQRVVAATDMNAHSSRSHAVFRLTIESRSPDQVVHIDGPLHDVVRVADFNLVDLAGSESVKMNNSSSTVRQRESGKINKSLLALTTVIHTLSLPPKKRPKHINYRDSKLTRILQPHLSGNAEMAILCCASPSKAFVEETKSTLKFATRAKLVEMKPKVNEVFDDGATIKKLQHELEEARKIIEEMKIQVQQSAGLRSSSSVEDSSDDVSLEYHNFGQPGSTDLPHPHEQRHNQNEDGISPDSPPGQKRSYFAQTKDSPELHSSRHSKSSLVKEEIFRNRSGPYSEDELPSKDQFNASAAGFQLDAADPHIARKALQRYLKGSIHSVDAEDLFTFTGSIDNEDGLQKLQCEISRAMGQEIMILTPQRGYTMNGTRDVTFDTPDKRNESTAVTESESYDGPETSFSEFSEKHASYLSSPETIRIEADDVRVLKLSHPKNALPRHFERSLSWDTMNLNTLRREQVGQPLVALQNLSSRNAPVPEEIMIISNERFSGRNECLTDKLRDAERRIAFLEGKLEKANDLVEDTFSDLDRARQCIHDLVQRNVEMSEKLRHKLRQDTKESYEKGEVVVEQYWLLKGSIYMSLFFFISGGHELFLASCFFVWLALEANMTA